MNTKNLLDQTITACCVVIFLFGVLLTQSVSANGIVMLVGDVLPLNNQIVWRNLVKIAGKKEGENLVIGAAHSRTKLYGEFALRSYQRYGDSAELLPIAEVFQEFSTDYQHVTEDQNVTDRVRASRSVFFVGGAPQRLSKVLFDKNRESTALAVAIQEAYQSGSLIVGGIPGRAVASTDLDAIEVITDGVISEDKIFPGLSLMEQDWYVDQHFFGKGRFAATIVAMQQLGIEKGIGVGLDTAAVVYNNTVEVLGNRGVVTVDLSNATFDVSRDGAMIRGVKLNYLENGDRIDMTTMITTPYSKKSNDFEIVPKFNASSSSVKDTFVSSQEMFRSGEFVRLMFKALDSKTGQSLGYALHHGDRMGFQFRFYTGPDSRGWLMTETGEDTFSLINVYLDIEPLG